jgi:hypothetical protein
LLDASADAQPSYLPARRTLSEPIDVPLPSLISPRHRMSQVNVWPAAGFVDTEKRCFMKLEVGYGEADI